MKQTISQGQFVDEFRKIRPENFTYYGLVSLYNYLTDYEDDIGEELEFDIIAICCDFTEYNSLKELQQEYPDVKSMSDLEDKTTVIPIIVCEGADNTGFIIRNY